MARKRKGSSKAGRPRKKGARFPSGKLKPPPANANVIERRKAGDAHAGEHPLDFALSQGWVTETGHRAGMAYVATFNRSHTGAIGPRLALQRLPESDLSESLRLNWSQLSDEQIVDIFDKVFSVEAAPEDKLEREAAAMVLWKRLNAALKPEERDELFMVCVIGSWPLWMPKKAQAYTLGLKDVRRESMLTAALDAVSRALKPPRKQADTITPLRYRRPRANLSEVPVRYETESGEAVTAMSEHGSPFEVTILRRRA
jgi:hypothetical protein